MAWLNATPKESEKTRREMYVAGSPYLDPPCLDAYETHLIALWHECGTVSQTGMGIAPLTWQEITSWAGRMFSEDAIEWVQSPTRRWMPVVTKQHTLFDYELQIIRHLSSEYASEYSQGSEPNRVCPKEINLTEVDGLAESTALGEALVSMFGGK